MGLLRFLFSKTFLRQIALTIPVSIGIIYGTLYLLKISTHHNEFINVPNLNRLGLEEVSKVLKEASLRYEVIDSAHYNPNYSPFSVIEQTPTVPKSTFPTETHHFPLNEHSIDDVHFEVSAYSIDYP